MKNLLLTSEILEINSFVNTLTPIIWLYQKLMSIYPGLIDLYLSCGVHDLET